MIRCRSFLAVLAAAAGVAACVSIPHDVEETFAPASPGEASNFRRRPDAPAPEGFVPPAPQERQAPPGASSAPTPLASSTAAPAPTSADAGAE